MNKLIIGAINKQQTKKAASWISWGWRGFAEK